MASPVGVCLRDFSEKCACVCKARPAQLVERKALNLVVMGGFEPHGGRLPMMLSKRLQSRSFSEPHFFRLFVAVVYQLDWLQNKAHHSRPLESGRLRVGRYRMFAQSILSLLR
uniref:Uncharacterized protein n=1 Tax=Peronospora matthiolae TaxID=2874970 RepID=A0AAV1T8B6_9STRA